MVLVDGAGTPLGAYLDAASPAEVTLLDHTLASMRLKGRPARLIADRGYDRNGLRRKLNAGGFSRSFRPTATTPTPPTRTGAACAGIAAAGLSSGRSAGWTTSCA